MIWRSSFACGLLVRATSVVVPLFVSSLAAAAPQYTISPFVVPDVGGVQFTDMNDQGVAVGFTIGNPSSAFMSNGTTATLLNPLPGGGEAFASGINNSGVIVGDSTNANGDTRAVYFGSGSTTTTEILPGGPDAAAGGINDNGQISGGTGQAFFYNGALTNIATGFSFSYGDVINASGQVAGTMSNQLTQSSGARGFFWSNGVTTNLGLPAGETSAAVPFVEGINDDGWVTGSWQRYVGNVPQNRRAFVYRNGAMEDLVPGWNFSDAFDINNLGQIIGDAALTSSGDLFGFLWDNGTAYDLDTLVIDPNSNWAVNGASAINNNGQILVSARFNGQNTFALLTPVVSTPVPAAVWLFGSGLAGLFAMTRRRRAH